MKIKYLKKIIRKIISQLLILVLITNSLMSFGAFSFAQEATNSAPLIITPQPTPIETSTPTPSTEQKFLFPTVGPTATPSATIVPTPITQTSTPTPSPTGQINLTPTEIPNITPSLTPTIAPISQSTIDALQNFIKESSSSAPMIGYAIKLPFDGSYPISLGFGETPDDPALQKEYESFGIIAHDGIDYELPDDTKVLASDLGIVLSAGPGIYGTTVTIYHTWGMTYYGHLSSVSVEPGQIVETGELIGYSGHTGLTTGPHLHFSVKPKNPDLTNGFHGMVDPNIYVDPKPQSEVLGISNAKKTGNNLKVFKSNENPDIEFTINDKNLNYILKDSSGKRIFVQKTITKKNNKNYFSFSGVGDFRPGKYTLTMTNSDGEAEEQEFYWGVLAVNTNKSVYLPGETAYLQMASLDNNGHTICDGKLELTINNEVLSTENGKIKHSNSCQGDNVTDSPDYYAYYQLDKTGIYQINLKNPDNGFEINDSFEVKKSLPFEVERVGATRINPFKASYKMTIKVKANEDFDGTIKEQAPKNFKITPETGIKVETVNDITEISWDKKIKAGEIITLQYEYNAPAESPQFYLLGPIKLFSSDQSVQFQESRVWQIVSDAAPNLNTLYPTAYSSQTGTAWTTTTVTNIDEGIAAADGLFIVAGANSTSSIFYDITDTPTDFVNMITLNYDIRYQITPLSNDTEVLYVQVFKSDKTTALTNEMTVVSTTTALTIRNKGSTAFTGVSTTATKAEWDAAYFRIRTAHTASGAKDNSVWSIDAFEMTGTYQLSPTVALNTPTNGATGQSTTPTLNFTGTDANSDTIEYNVQVDTAVGFDSIGSSPTFVQSKSAESAGTAGTTATVTPTSTPTSGNLLFVAVTQTTTTGRATMGGSGWTELTGAHTDGLSSVETHLQTFYKISDGTETPITATFGSANWIISFAEYSGVATTSSLDIDNANVIGSSTSTTTAFSTPIVTPTSSANRLIITTYQGRDAVSTWTSEQINSSTTGVTEREDLEGSGGNTNTLSISDKFISSTSGTYQGSATATSTATFGGASIAIFKAGLSPLLSKFSSIPDAGFTAGHPFTSGTAINYTVQAADTLTAGITYYWRVAGIDPSGSNAYGAWSSIYSFTTSSAGPTLDQLMRHGTWFNSNVKQPFTF